jgi:hypothetical protein
MKSIEEKTGDIDTEVDSGDAYMHVHDTTVSVG